VYLHFDYCVQVFGVDAFNGLKREQRAGLGDYVLFDDLAYEGDGRAADEFGEAPVWGSSPDLTYPNFINYGLYTH
jgi:hypothetical protein